MSRRRRILLIALMPTLAGCGALPPQAPLPEAQRLDRATSGISSACGESAEITAFGGPHAPGLRALETTASTSARKLAGVAARNPRWIYQGQTVRQIVGASLQMLGSCDLPAARDVLARATHSR